MTKKIVTLAGDGIEPEILAAIVVPGSRPVKKEAERLGLDKIFMDAGFEWREPSCSMCLGMNPDHVQKAFIVPQQVIVTLKGSRFWSAYTSL